MDNTHTITFSSRSFQHAESKNSVIARTMPATSKPTNLPGSEERQNAGMHNSVALVLSDVAAYMP
jgi:hypothetical protein